MKNHILTAAVAAVLVGRQAIIIVIRIHRPGQGQLFDVGHAGYALGLELGSGQGGQEQRGQDGNDGDDDQQFDQGEA